MKINKVKQFVANNISRLEKSKDSCLNYRIFNLYDKDNIYRGEYQFIKMHSSDYLGVKTSMSSTRIMNDKLNQELQEIVYINKDYITLKDTNSDTLTKVLPSEITTTTTVLDFVNDKFKTIRTVSKLKNLLQRLSKDDPNLIYSDTSVIYEPLKDKLQYEKNVEFVREGSISESKRHPMAQKRYSWLGSINQIPYIYW